MAFSYKDEKVIGFVQKNSAERIIVRTALVNGKPRVDARVHFSLDDQEYQPTKKGINLPGDSVEKLVMLLFEARKQLPKEEPPKRDQYTPSDN